MFFGLLSCNPDDHSHYINDKCIIVDKGGNEEKNGKYNIVNKTLLIRRISDTTMYTELNTKNWDGLNEIYGSPLYYSKEIGDTLFFKYIRKKSFTNVI